MPVLDRDALQASPLADLHALASELSIDGYRRLRKADLIDSILGRQGGAPAAPRRRRHGRRRRRSAQEPRPRARRGRRSGARSGGRARARGRGAGDAEPPTRKPSPQRSPPRSRRTRAPLAAGAPSEAAEPAAEARAEEPRRRSRSSRGWSSFCPTARASSASPRPSPPTRTSTSPPPRSSAASSSPATPSAGRGGRPRRSERFASLVRVDTINGSPAAELASGTRFDELPAAFPDRADPARLRGRRRSRRSSPLAPFGKGSRVTITGGASGRARPRRFGGCAGVLAGQDGLQLSLVLAGVRPEEIAEWRAGEPARPRRRR